MATTTSIKLVIPSRVRFVDLAHTAAEKMAETAGFDADEALNIGLAVREAAINAIVHGNGRDPERQVRISLTTGPQALEVKVRDQGNGFNPDQTPDPVSDDNLLSTSGRGLLLIRAFVDEVVFRQRKDGMEIILKKRLNPDHE